jgi:hypothetical protein
MKRSSCCRGSTSIPTRCSAWPRSRSIETSPRKLATSSTVPSGGSLGQSDRSGGALELAVRADAAAGRIGNGRAAAAELQQIADSVATDPVRASAAVARGVLAAAAGQLKESLDGLEDALDVFERTRVPFEAAQMRVELAQVLAALGREERAVQEARKA